MKHKKLLRKQGGSACGGSTSNGNQSDENCEEEKSNAGDSIAETGDIDDNEERSGESLDSRERGSNIESPLQVIKTKILTTENFTNIFVTFK